jgi:hypothetical protein
MVRLAMTQVGFPVVPLSLGARPLGAVLLHRSGFAKESFDAGVARAVRWHQEGDAGPDRIAIGAALADEISFPGRKGSTEANSPSRHDGHRRYASSDSLTTRSPARRLEDEEVVHPVDEASVDLQPEACLLAKADDVTVP